MEFVDYQCVDYKHRHLTGYFRDGERRIDLVLVGRDSKREQLEVLKLNFFMNLINAGLELEIENGIMKRHKHLYFVKIHAPAHILKHFGSYYSITKFFKKNHLDMSEQNIREEREIIKLIRESYPEPVLFSTHERSVIVYKMLEVINFGEYKNYVGIHKLLERKIILDAYALHDGPFFLVRRQKPTHVNGRQALMLNWVGYRNLYRCQPIHLIREYLGERLAFLFKFHERIVLIMFLAGLAGPLFFYLNMNLKSRYGIMLSLVTHNIRTLRTDEKLAELEEELSRLHWDILGLSEVQREEEDTITLKSGNLLYYREGDQQSQGGVGFFVHKSLINKCVEQGRVLNTQGVQKLFQRAHEENPKGIHKVVPIIGDMELPGLGISEEDRKTLVSKVSIIINAAATVKFDEKLSISTGINVRGTKEVLRLAKECKKLKVVTHVSTAFANTHVNYIEEKFYDPPMSVEALEAVSELDERLIEGILPQLLGKHPNTYCFTKAIAEAAVKKYGEGLPICILRPSIVVSTYEEPVRGWTDSVYGPTGLVIGIGTGVLRTMYMKVDKVADMVPVDLVVNAILASAWHTAKNFKENQTSDIPIYNYVSGAQNPIKWGEFIEVNRRHGINTPTTKAVWYYGLNPANNYYTFLFYNFFLHYLPALMIDSYCALTGRRRAVLPIYNKMIKLANILFYFSTQDWRFSDKGVRSMWSSLSEQDRAVFPFNIGDMSWEYMCETFLLGLRVYLLKDNLSTLPEARKKWNRLFVLHQIVKLVTFSLLFYVGYLILKSLTAVILG